LRKKIYYFKIVSTIVLTKNIMEKYINKLTKTSKYSFNLVVPKEIIKKYGWREKQKLVITDKGRGKLEIRDWRRR